MVSFFWQRGFYINRQLFIYNNLTFFTFNRVFGLSHEFVRLFSARCEGFHNPQLVLAQNYKHHLPVCLRKIPLTLLSTTERLILNILLTRTFPVLLSFFNQLRFNLYFYYFTKTYRGFALRMGKPLKSRTRGRTFHSRRKKKKLNKHRQVITTSRWF